MPTTVASSQDPLTPEVSAQPPSDEETSSKPEKVVKATPEEQGTDESKSKARAEFFQKITQASDDGGKQSYYIIFFNFLSIFYWI